VPTAACEVVPVGESLPDEEHAATAPTPDSRRERRIHFGERVIMAIDLERSPRPH
jgi:hypothetical protein